MLNNKISFINVFGNSSDNTNVQHELLFINRKVSRFRKANANNLSGNKKLSKTRVSRMVQSGGLFENMETFSNYLIIMGSLVNSAVAFEKDLQKLPEKLAENIKK